MTVPTSLNALIAKVAALQNKVCCLETRLADANTAITELQAMFPADAAPSSGTVIFTVIDGVPQYVPICTILSQGYTCSGDAYGDVLL